MKLLLFKVSSCGTCQKQEELLKKYNIPYTPCELFKNRELARKYGVKDVPCSVLLDDENIPVKRYNFLINDIQIENIKKFL